MNHFDIVVVGGGMTGSALALGAAHQGWRTALVETSPLSELLSRPAEATSVDDIEPRVSAISVASQRLLESLGAWKHISETRHCPYTAMDVWDGEAIGRIRFDAAELGAPALGTIVENRHLVRGLFQVVDTSAVTCLDGQTVSRLAQEGQGWRVSLGDGSDLTADLVVGADGAHSRIRQWAGLPTREWDYDQEAIVCTVKTERHHQFTAWQRFTPTGPLAFLPLATEGDGSDGHFCSIVWSQDTLEARRLMALEPPAFMAELTRALEGRLGEVQAMSGRHAFPLRQRHGKVYVRRGLALIGDAAHTIHPLAGQGANLGYGDVVALLDELDTARNRRQSPGELTVLERYQRRRKGENLAMMAAMEGFKQLFGRDELVLRWLRSRGMRWLDRMKPLKNRVAAEAMGL
ncbi:2-octaprenylphenol hydroxylase [Marinobacter daqiaonensis]|uniref:2-octaprenylphenol hydroxylase n=1 Tax=Marinobacter daqiaonensis TaxID=650891 RepID=A0A1I6I0I4_9GAMM|nr:UbiH/UbiF/VisC/COQ6 family ubiquinone biosynthesis hydroxylase [Marinobacter daqiaonensis]SFR60232.1 2-octaprenylphenol hydroxylase [Marinobacter daqiaonensis]